MDSGKRREKPLLSPAELLPELETGKVSGLGFCPTLELILSAMWGQQAGKGKIQVTLGNWCWPTPMSHHIASLSYLSLSSFLLNCLQNHRHSRVERILGPTQYSPVLHFSVVFFSPTKCEVCPDSSKRGMHPSALLSTWKVVDPYQQWEPDIAKVWIPKWLAELPLLPQEVLQRLCGSPASPWE